MEIKDALQNPLETNDGKTIEKKFEEIAKNLIHNFCIKCGEKTFYFAEIEFYYYDKDNNNQKWNWETYPRTDKEAGDLFFHYSGVDICFNSSFGKGKFGGILIRSLYDVKEKKFITGPSVCANEILNSCSKSKKWPEIIKEEGVCKCVIPDPIIRYGIEDVCQCFYNKELFDKFTAEKNAFEKYSTWDFDKKHNGQNPRIVEQPRYYRRFKENK